MDRANSGENEEGDKGEEGEHEGLPPEPLNKNVAKAKAKPKGKRRPCGVCVPRVRVPALACVPRHSFATVPARHGQGGVESPSLESVEAIAVGKTAKSGVERPSLEKEDKKNAETIQTLIAAGPLFEGTGEVERGVSSEEPAQSGKESTVEQSAASGQRSGDLQEPKGSGSKPVKAGVEKTAADKEYRHQDGSDQSKTKSSLFCLPQEVCNPDSYGQGGLESPESNVPVSVKDSPLVLERQKMLVGMSKIAVGKAAKSGAERPSLENVEVNKAGSEMLRNCLNLSRDKAASEEVATEKVAAEKIAVGKAVKLGAESPSLEKRVASGEHAEATPAKAAASSFDLAGSASGSTRVRQPYEAPPPVKQLGPSIHAPMRVEDLDHDEAPPEGKLAASTKGGGKGIPSTAPTTTQPSRSWTSSSRSWSWWGASGWGR